MSKTKILGCLAAMFLGACSASRLTSNTDDISITVFPLYSGEILANLSRFIDDPWAVPSQSDIQSGTVLTLNTVNPSATFPLVSGITNTITNSATPSVTRAAALGAAGGTISASEGWQQSWNIIPLTDANALRNLQALYRFAVFDTNVRKEYHVPRVQKGANFFDDPYLLLQPHCIVCGPNRQLNPRLHGGWLYWTNDNVATSPERPIPPNESFVDLGYFGHHRLFMIASDYQAGYLNDFILFTLPNAGPAQQDGGKQSSPTSVPGRAPAPINRPSAAPTQNPPVPSFR